MRKVLGVCTILILFLFAAPAALPSPDYYGRGNPCFAERTTYFSDANHTTIVGADEYICWDGHRIWGQRTSYWTYEFLGSCCSVCTSTGVCGVEP
jgi:hypothetical protein